MNSANGKKLLGVLLTLALLSIPVWAKRIKTDGKNKESPIKIVSLDFMDSGYGNPGPNSEIRISTKVQNTSSEDDLRHVVIHLQLKNLAGEVVQEWTKNIPVMKKGAVVEFEPDGVYYNYSFNNLSGAVMVEHDEIEEEEDSK